MKQIDYSVPDKVKDTTPQFKVGDCVIGDCVYCREGCITKIAMSEGKRKGLLYYLDDTPYCFFYNFLKPWYDLMISAIIGKDKEYVPEVKVKFNYKGTEYAIKGITYNSITEWCWVRVDKDINLTNIDGVNRGICFSSLKPKQRERIYNELFCS